MKRFKQLLCFIIPSVLCWVLYFIPSRLFDDATNKPSFVVFENYLRLFINDDTFIKALFNSIKTPLIVALVTVTIALVLRCILKKYKYSDLITYSSLSAVNVFLYIINSFLLSQSQTAFKMMLSGYGSIYYEIFYKFNFKVVLMSLEWGIFACFLYWVSNFIVEKIKRHRQIIKMAKENFNKTLKNFAEQNPEELTENFDMNDFSLHYQRAKRNKNVVSYIFTVKYKNQKKYSYILKLDDNYAIFDDVFYKNSPNTDLES